MNYIDMFSGIGGFNIALKKNGFVFDNEYHSDIEKYVLNVYGKRFPKSVSLGDISKIDEKDLDDIDVLTAGFPCQDISVAGKQKGLHDGDKQTRSGLFFEITRIAKEKKPKFMVLENVRNLLTGGETRGQWLRIILNELHNIGYDCEWEIISAADVGGLHKRERIWIVCFPQKIKDKIETGIVFDSNVQYRIGHYQNDDWFVDGAELDFIDFDDDDEEKVLVSDFPKSGSMVNGVLYKRNSIVEMDLNPNVMEKYWLTPSVVQIEPTEGRREKRSAFRESIGRKDVPGCLAEQVDVPTMWPTPTADCATDRDKKYSQGGTPLTLAAKMWPTPNASDQYDANLKDDHDLKKGHLRGVVKYPTPTQMDSRDKPFGKRKHHSETGKTPGGQKPGLLEHVVGYKDESYPTPRANDSQHSKFGQPSFEYRKDKKYMAECVMDSVPEPERKGYLNPDWVEWLMGYNLGWTDIEKDDMGQQSNLRTEWDGISKLTDVIENRRARLKALGNAIVPQCAEYVVYKITQSSLMEDFND